MKAIAKAVFSFLLLFNLSAQEINPELESNSEEKGFKITDDSKLNVSMAVSPEYNTNITRASSKTVNKGVEADEISDIIMHFTPGVRFKIKDSDKFLTLGIQMDYNYYTGYEEKSTTESLSTMHIKSKSLGEFNKGSAWKFGFENNFARSSYPQTQILTGLAANMSESFIASGSWNSAEETLLFKFSSSFTMNYYENKFYSKYNYNNYGASIYGRWKFFPKTAIFLNSSINYQDFYNAGGERDEQNSMPLNIFGGIIGQFTPKLSLKLSGGFVNTYSYTPKKDFTAGAEAVWKFSEFNIASLGYLRSYFPVSGYQYFRQDTISASYKHKIFRNILAGADGSYAFISFGPYTGKDPAFLGKSRSDRLIKFNSFAAMNITDWSGLKLDYSFEKKDTPFFTDIYEKKSDSYVGKNYYEYTVHTIMLTALIDY